MQSLSHPSIPQYIEYFELNNPNLHGFALVQTYIDAQSLQTYLINGCTFSETEIKQLAKQLLLILNYLHSHQPCIIHRDIKPSNILLTNRSSHSVGDVYLVDFGSLHIANYQDGTITIVGTYGYMPPEQFGGKVFPASDIYSLGTTLIYLITGVEPADLPQNDLQIQFEQFTKISSSFRDWLKLMTHPSLKKRFSSVAESLNALESGKIQSNKTPFSKVVIEKIDGSLKIVISYNRSNSAKNYNVKAINKMKQPYHKSWLKIFCRTLITPGLLIFALLSLAPFIFLIWTLFTQIPTQIFIILSIALIIFNHFDCAIHANFIKNKNLFKDLLPDENKEAFINKNVKSIDYLTLNITSQEIILTLNYTSKLKTQEVYTVFQEPIQRLSSIVFKKKSYQEVEVNDEGNIKIQEQELAPMLSLNIGKKRHGLSYQLNMSELYLLAEEISNFVDIPITWV